MTAIRVIFDGKAFIPQGPVSLPARSEGVVLVQQNDPSAQARIDAEVSAYYQDAASGGGGAEDADDAAWADATARRSSRAWDED